MALLWAGGMCWSATAFVTPSADEEDSATANVSNIDQAADLEHLQALVARLEP